MGGSQIIGDKFYGTKQVNKHFRGVHGLPRQFLHACFLRFRHPSNRAWVHVESPLPEDLRGFVRRLPPPAEWTLLDSAAAAAAAAAPSQAGARGGSDAVAVGGRGVDLCDLPLRCISLLLSDEVTCTLSE